MNDLAKTWGIWILRGIASLLFGVLTIWRPGASLAALVLVYGSYALADGLILLGVAFRSEGHKGAYVVRGLLSIAAGVLTFAYPGLTATSLYILIGAWAIACGAVELGIAIWLRGRAPNVGVLVLVGALSLLCGVALLALPLAGVIALLSLIAAYAIMNGIVAIGVGLRIHRLFPQHAAS